MRLANVDGGVRSARAASVIWLVGAFVFLATEAIAAASVPGYSYVTDYISDLGVRAVMNIGFMLHGTLFLLGAIVISRSLMVWIGWGFVLATAANAIGNVLVGSFRSGVSQTAGGVPWHVIGASMAIVGGNIAVIIAGFGSRRVGASRLYRRVSVAIGIFGIACVVTLMLDGANGFRVLPAGVVERGSVYTVVAWELMTGVAILRHRGDD
jgi:hypothetical membrane protein